MNTAILPFSGDPITWGHVNVVERALQVFDHLVVAIGINSAKKYTFTTEERESLTKKVLRKYGERVSVKSFTGLLVDFALEQNIKTIVRGARNSMDLAFEQMLSDVNRASDQGIDTLIMFSDQKMSHISSSVAKEVLKEFGKNILDYVPMPVKQAMEEKICGQFRIGVTGEIGAGKSEVTRELMKIHNIERFKDDSHNVDLDALGRYILTEATQPLYVATRNTLSDRFLLKVSEVGTRNFIDVKQLSDIIFKSSDARQEFNYIMREPMYLLLRQKVAPLKGIVFINSALLVEANILDFVNNNVILVLATNQVRQERLIARGYDFQEVTNRMGAQLDANQKARAITESIERHGHGRLIEYENSGPIDESCLKGVLNNLYRRCYG
jgi:pantetheine-phosphate adenylyltransferase